MGYEAQLVVLGDIQW